MYVVRKHPVYNSLCAMPLVIFFFILCFMNYLTFHNNEVRLKLVSKKHEQQLPVCRTFRVRIVRFQIFAVLLNEKEICTLNTKPINNICNLDIEYLLNISCADNDRWQNILRSKYKLIFYYNYYNRYHYNPNLYFDTNILWKCQQYINKILFLLMVNIEITFFNILASYWLRHLLTTLSSLPTLALTSDSTRTWERR